jgi:hypothetical protein
MDWRDYFKLTVLRETLQGPHRYFHADLCVREQFDMDELLLKEFDHLGMSEKEIKQLSITVRKILLRHSFFKTPEFDRIIDNFAERISNEKEQLLTFSTQGSGVYLFAGLIRKKPTFLKEKKLICYTSDLPLDLYKVNYLDSRDVHIIHRPYSRSTFKNFPSLWQKSIMGSCASF